MLQKTDLTKDQKKFIELFRNKLCLISHACEAAKISRQTYYRWLENDEFKIAIEDVRESIKDFGENALLKLIAQGNPQAIIFYNKTKNKDRGYVEKQEIEQTGPSRLIINEVIYPGEDKNIKETSTGSEIPRV